MMLMPEEISAAARELTDLTPAVSLLQTNRREGMKLKQKLKRMMLCFQDEGRMRASTSLSPFTLWIWTEEERSNKKLKK